MLLYVAGKYRGNVDENIAAARRVAADLYLAGHNVICPHMNTAHMDDDTGLPDAFWLDATLQLLARCDGIMMCPGWEESRGSVAERQYAIDVGMPVYEFPDVPPPHQTEAKSPIQCQAFLGTVMSMYRLHLSKNADYSPMNILGTGEIGVIVRLWDKVARLLNLTGFRIKAEFVGFDAAREPKHETINDTYHDAAVYSIIGLLVRQGRWGK